MPDKEGLVIEIHPEKLDKNIRGYKICFLCTERCRCIHCDSMTVGLADCCTTFHNCGIQVVVGG